MKSLCSKARKTSLLLWASTYDFTYKGRLFSARTHKFDSVLKSLRKCSIRNMSSTCHLFRRHANHFLPQRSFLYCDLSMISWTFRVPVFKFALALSSFRCLSSLLIDSFFTNNKMNRIDYSVSKALKTMGSTWAWTFFWCSFWSARAASISVYIQPG